MAITLGSLTLPEDLIWVDEFKTTHVANQIKNTLTGALVIEESVLQKGRLISLEGGIDYGWISRADLLLLRAEQETADNTLVLTLNDGQVFNTRFRRDVKAVIAEPVIDYNSPLAVDWYSLKIYLMEV